MTFDKPFRSDRLNRFATESAKKLDDFRAESEAAMKRAQEEGEKHLQDFEAKSAESMRQFREESKRRMAEFGQETVARRQIFDEEVLNLRVTPLPDDALPFTNQPPFTAHTAPQTKPDFENMKQAKRSAPRLRPLLDKPTKL